MLIHKENCKPGSRVTAHICWRGGWGGGRVENNDTVRVRVEVFENSLSPKNKKITQYSLTEE